VNTLVGKRISACTWFSLRFKLCPFVAHDAAVPEEVKGRSRPRQSHAHPRCKRNRMSLRQWCVADRAEGFEPTFASLPQYSFDVLECALLQIRNLTSSHSTMLMGDLENEICLVETLRQRVTQHV
jgi:hypothetical protein